MDNIDTTLEQHRDTTPYTPAKQPDTTSQGKKAQSQTTSQSGTKTHTDAFQERVEELEKRQEQTWSYKRGKLIRSLVHLSEGASISDSERNTIRRDLRLEIIRLKKKGDHDETVAHLEKLLQQLVAKPKEPMVDPDVTIKRVLKNKDDITQKVTRKPVDYQTDPHASPTEKIIILSKTSSHRRDGFHEESTEKVHNGEIVETNDANKDKPVYLTERDPRVLTILPRITSRLFEIESLRVTEPELQSENPEAIRAYALAEEIVLALHDTEELRPFDTSSMRHELFLLIGTKLLPKKLRIKDVTHIQGNQDTDLVPRSKKDYAYSYLVKSQKFPPSSMNFTLANFALPDSHRTFSQRYVKFMEQGGFEKAKEHPSVYYMFKQAFQQSIKHAKQDAVYTLQDVIIALRLKYQKKLQIADKSPVELLETATTFDSEEEGSSPITDPILLEEMHSSLQDARKKIEIAPNDSTAHGYLGFLLTRFGKYKAALESYNTAITLNPKSPTLYMRRANVLFALDQEAEALADAQKSKELEDEKLSALTQT